MSGGDIPDAGRRLRGPGPQQGLDIGLRIPPIGVAPPELGSFRAPLIVDEPGATSAGCLASIVHGHPYRRGNPCGCALWAPLEHDPEKWIPVFGKDRAPTRA